MAVPDSSETAQAESDGPEGSDKPPHGQISQQTQTRPPAARNTAHVVPLNGLTNGGAPQSISPSTSTDTHASIPLPPPEAGSYRKETGHTAADLEKLSISDHPQDFVVPARSYSPSTMDSPSASESESWSIASSRPASAAPSRAASRAPSMSSGVSGGKLPGVTSASKSSKKEQKKDNASHSPQPPPLKSEPGSATTVKAKGPPSVASEGGGTKFTLKDLLASGPKLARKSSQRSTGSSKKSDSDGGANKSTAGDSAVSLTKKYGVCQKIAIGKGATSVVRLAHKWDRSEEKLYAVKEFRKRRKNESEKEYVKKLTAEFCISSTLHHTNIVETVDLIQDEQSRWCEVMEFCPGGDLYAAIKKGGMSPSEVECCFKQILCGVSYLHSQGVAHRDIKPENLFFDTKGHLKIGDYGASTVYRLPWEATIHMSTGLCGSEPYIAPEQFLGKPYDARLVDIWACGIVYYCLHFQELPWRVAQTSDPLYAAYTQACASPQAAQAACPPTINNLSPRACRPVIRMMLEPDPKRRATIEDVIKHPWVQSVEVCHAVAKPSHMHVHARALAQAQVQVMD